MGGQEQKLCFFLGITPIALSQHYPIPHAA